MKTSSQLWVYVTIVLIYFLLLGIVIVILLLAPKYPSLTTTTTTTTSKLPSSSWNSDYFGPQNPQNDLLLIGLGNVNKQPELSPPYAFDQSNSFPNYDDIPSSQQQINVQGQSQKKPPFIPSRRDPIYDIDPRSSRASSHPFSSSSSDTGDKLLLLTKEKAQVRRKRSGRRRTWSAIHN